MKKLKALWKNYKAPTPDKWRKIGDSLLIISIGLDGIVATLPIPEKVKIWIMAIISVMGVAGKFLTNFYAPKDDGGKAE